MKSRSGRCNGGFQTNTNGVRTRTTRTLLEERQLLKTVRAGGWSVTGCGQQRVSIDKFIYWVPTGPQRLRETALFLTHNRT